MWIYFLIFVLIFVIIIINNSSFNVVEEEHFENKQQKKAINQINNLKKILSQQIIIGNKELNPNYTPPSNIKINNRYKLLIKDPVETDIRNKAEKDIGIEHMRPDINDPYKTNGYSYINPALWDVPQNRPPICIPQKGYEAIVQPLPTTGTPLEALEWKEVLPRFTYNQVYDPKYYYPGYQSI
jgi:hypothetical protein